MVIYITPDNSVYFLLLVSILRMEIAEEIDELWKSSEPSGASYTAAASETLRDALNLVPNQYATSAIQTAYAQAVGSALSSPCHLLRQGALELFLLHSRLSMDVGKWHAPTAVEACLMRAVFKAFPGFECINVTTSSMVLDNVSFASSMHVAYMRAHAVRSPALIKDLNDINCEARLGGSGLHRSGGSSKTSHVIALMMGMDHVPRKDEQHCTKTSTGGVGGCLEWGAVADCTVEQWVTLLESVLSA